MSLTDSSGLAFCIIYNNSWENYKDCYKGNNPKKVRDWKINFPCTLQSSTRIVELIHIEYPKSNIFKILPLDFTEVRSSLIVLKKHRSVDNVSFKGTTDTSAVPERKMNYYEVSN